jgi:ribonuclease P protein component
VIPHLQRPVDFERVLARPSRARSPHFALHHLAEPLAPSPWQERQARQAARAATADKAVSPELPTAASELSTGSAQPAPTLVDQTLPLAPAGHWVGVVVPKRHAKRAVTRSLIKRQMRAAFEARPGLPPGLWVVRLRSPFDRKHYPSAASDALRDAARAELAQLLDRALR